MLHVKTSHFVMECFGEEILNWGGVLAVRGVVMQFNIFRSSKLLALLLRHALLVALTSIGPLAQVQYSVHVQQKKRLRERKYVVRSVLAGS